MTMIKLAARLGGRPPVLARPISEPRGTVLLKGDSAPTTNTDARAMDRRMIILISIRWPAFPPLKVFLPFNPAEGNFLFFWPIHHVIRIPFL
jgi:hypothetical protein